MDELIKVLVDLQISCNITNAIVKIVRDGIDICQMQ